MFSFSLQGSLPKLNFPDKPGNDTLQPQISGSPSFKYYKIFANYSVLRYLNES